MDDIPANADSLALISGALIECGVALVKRTFEWRPEKWDSMEVNDLERSLWAAEGCSSSVPDGGEDEGVIERDQPLWEEPRVRLEGVGGPTAIA